MGQDTSKALPNPKQMPMLAQFQGTFKALAQAPKKKTGVSAVPRYLQGIGSLLNSKSSSKSPLKSSADLIKK